MPLRTSAATAGKVFTARITWFNATSGGTSLGNSDTVVTVAAQSGWWLTNYGYVVRDAPAGALSAVLTVTVANVPLAEYVNIDDVYVASAARIPGNFLSYNDQSFEQDISGWTVQGSGTGTMVQAEGFGGPGGGYRMLSATSTTTAGTQVFTGLKPITPGVEYLGCGWVAGAAGTADTVVQGQIRWYDASSVEMGTLALKAWTIKAGVFTLINVVGTAPAGAVSGRLFFRAPTPAAGYTWYMDEVFFGAAPNAAGNLLTYDEFSSETALPPWTVTGPSDPAVQYALNLTHPSQDGGYVMALTPTGTGTIAASLDRLIPVTPGQTYQASAAVWFLGNSDPNATSTSRVRLDWYDSSGVLTQAGTPPPYYSSAGGLPGYTGTISQSTGRAPSGAVYGKLTVEIMHTTATTVTAYYVDNIQWVVSDPSFNASVINDTGSVSLSIFTMPDAGLGGTYTLRRVHQDGSMQPVRGYVGDLVRVPFTQSPIVVEDYEAPMGEIIAYLVEWYNASGDKILLLSIGVGASPVLEDPDYVWLKSPGIPALNTTVLMESPVKWSRPARSTTLDIVGRTNPVNISGKRAGGTSSLSVLVWDPSAHEQLNSLLDNGLPVLIQAMPGYGINGNLYLSVGDVDSDPVMDAANEPGWRWTLNVAKIDRPSGGIQGSAISTWQDILDGYDTWADVFDAFGTWADVLLIE
jgi:hypothetical protein